MDPSARPDGDSPADPSPTETRRPSQSAAVARDDARTRESFQSTDTVRRRPEGSIRSPIPASSGGESTGPELLVPRANQGPSRSPGLSSERGPARPRKPPMTRRASSSAQGRSYRGEVFSVDDGIAEVEADAAERQQNYGSTLRRRPPALSRIHSSHDNDGTAEGPDDPVDQIDSDPTDGTGENTTGDDLAEDSPPVDEDGEVSEAESFTLKDRQQAINQTHPFGIRLWKPALYRKSRSVQKNAEGDIHSSPGGHVSNWLLFFNLLWTFAFGWWMALIAFVGAVICFLFAAAPGGREYGRVLWGLSGYLFYPFGGKFVRLEQQEAYLDEDEGEGRSISEYEQWQSGDLEYGRLFFGPEGSRSIVGRSRRSIDSEPDETESLLGRGRGRALDDHFRRNKRRLFGRGEWNVGRAIFFAFFYFLITPSLFIVSGICWLLVFSIPMGKVTMLLFSHLRRHPLALWFESDTVSARAPTAPHSSILVCTYRAVGIKYWKYTIDGTNIFLINLMAVVVFVIFDWLVLDGVLHLENFLTSPAFLFVSGLLSIIPLAYFIGQAVASISAQSSMGLGAAINAFFSTVVEVFLYCVALQQGKGQLVEGSIVGSIFAGILFLPGLSMCFGAIKRKTQRFNAKSAGVTSTMLLFAVIGAFGPTLFYQIYGTHELTCQDCTNFDQPNVGGGALRDCRRCYFSQTPALNDRFYLQAVRPYCYMAASMLFLSYIIGLWFTLRTHAAVIWNIEIEEKKHEDHITPHNTPRPPGNPSVGDTTGADIRDSHLYKRILGQSLRQVGQLPRSDEPSRQSTPLIGSGGVNGTPHVVPPKPPSYGSTETSRSGPTISIPGLSEAENSNLVQQVAEIAATAATVAARNVQGSRRGPPGSISTVAAAHTSAPGSRSGPIRSAALFPEQEETAGTAGSTQAHGGHDAPNWSRLKSAIILMGATVLYAVIAEILVDTVDVVLESFDIDEKFLGITLFALVPNTTEFLNAISFAMNGNIALSMEIGSAYALQVCLLQIPALVLFSAVRTLSPAIPPQDVAHYTFSLLFPQWDMVTVILCVFLLSYMYGEGKSNYFKGSILLLSYLVVVIGYYFSGFGTSLDSDARGVSRFDTLASDGQWMSYGFKTVGRRASGVAF